MKGRVWTLPEFPVSVTDEIGRTLIKEVPERLSVPRRVEPLSAKEGRAVRDLILNSRKEDF